MPAAAAAGVGACGPFSVLRRGSCEACVTCAGRPGRNGPGRLTSDVASRSTPPPKPCVACGRVIEWRKKWERDWDHVKYCSDACRRRGSGDLHEIERVIRDLLARRDPLASGKTTICPSEIARARWPDDWHDHMEDIRRAARRLVAAGEIEITQSGQVVDPSTARGPIRLRRVRC